ncbi:hypothetical protein ACFVY5_00200, partial [Streptomyces parvulus]
MSSSGLIYAVIVGAWAAYLVPMWLRRQDELNEARPTERFSTAIRLLSGRAGMERRYAKDQRSRPADEAEPDTGAPDAVTDSVDVRAFAVSRTRQHPRPTPPQPAEKRPEKARPEPAAPAQGPGPGTSPGPGRIAGSGAAPARARVPQARRSPASPAPARRAEPAPPTHNPAPQRRPTPILFPSLSLGLSLCSGVVS